MPAPITGSAAPGVHVSLNTGQIARPAQLETASRCFAVGYTPWGPVDTPTVVTSWRDYTTRFGGFNANSFLDDFAYIYFNLYPGSEMVVCRGVGSGASVATLSIQDRGVGGAQRPALRIDGKYPSSTVDLRVTIEAGTLANTFKLTVRSIVLGAREVFDNLAMDAASLLRVNQASQLIRLTDLASSNAAPTNLPTLTAETLLTGGSDDFSTVTAARLIGTDNGTTRTGLQAFNSEEFGSGQVSIPGITTEAAHAALIAHAENFKRTAICDEAVGSTAQDAVATRALYGTPSGALYWPQVSMLDFAGSGLTKLYAPSGFVAGACALADREVGTHQAPANKYGRIPGALDVERNASGLSQTDENTSGYLNGRDVNCITRLPEQSVKIYGERVMTGDNRVQMVHEIRTLNLIYYQLKRTYQSIPFSVVDGTGKLFREVRSLSESYLRILWRAGALFGQKQEEAFIVICDTTNNTPDTLNAQQVFVQVGVRLSPTAEMVLVNIDSVPLNQDLSVLQS